MKIELIIHNDETWDGLKLDQTWSRIDFYDLDNLVGYAEYLRDKIKYARQNKKRGNLL